MVLPASLPGAEYVKKGQAKGDKSQSSSYPNIVKDNLLPEAWKGQGRENTKKMGKTWEKTKQMGLSQGEICPVDRKCLFGIVLKVSFSACVPEARGKSLTIFKEKFDALCRTLYDMIGCCSQEMDTLTQERHSSTALLSSGSGRLQASLSFSGGDRKRN